MLAKIDDQSSKNTLIVHKVTPITGASQNIVAAGLFIPISSFLSKRCVKLHRKPPSALAVVTKTNPDSMNLVSAATIIRTPMKMSRMTPTSRRENFSNLKKKANVKTKISDEDLHMANRCVKRLNEGVDKMKRTVKG